MSRRPTLAAALGLLLLPGVAAAENHFLFEANGGVTTPLGTDADVSLGPGFAVSLGVGGKLRGFAPAWYLVGRLGYGQSTETGPNRFGAAELDRGALEAALGGRVYIPVYGERLRLVGEMAFGEVWEEATVKRAHHPALSLESNPFAMFFLAGLQYRLNDHLAFGGGADLGWYFGGGDREDLGAVATGLETTDASRGRLRLALTTTVHF